MPRSKRSSSKTKSSPKSSSSSLSQERKDEVMDMFDNFTKLSLNDKKTFFKKIGWCVIKSKGAKSPSSKELDKLYKEQYDEIEQSVQNYDNEEKDVFEIDGEEYTYDELKSALKSEIVTSGSLLRFIKKNKLKTPPNSKSGVELVDAIFFPIEKIVDLSTDLGDEDDDEAAAAVFELDTILSDVGESSEEESSAPASPKKRNTRKKSPIRSYVYKEKKDPAPPKSSKSSMIMSDVSKFEDAANVKLLYILSDFVEKQGKSLNLPDNAKELSKMLVEYRNLSDSDKNRKVKDFQSRLDKIIF